MNGEPLAEILGDQINLRNQIIPYEAITGGFPALLGCVKKAIWTKRRTCLQDPNLAGFENIEIANTVADSLEEGYDCNEQSILVWCLAVAQVDRARRGAMGLILLPAQMPPAESFGGPLPVTATDNSHESNIFDRQQNVNSDALGHIRRPPPSPPPDADYDAGAREGPQYHGYFCRVGFTGMTVDFRSKSKTPNPVDYLESMAQWDGDPEVERWSWFDDCEPRAIFLV